MPAARNHNTLWFACVAFSSTMNQLLTGNSIDSDSLTRKGKLIEALNFDLCDSMGQILDETIAAVVALASIEVSLTNLERILICRY